MARKKNTRRSLSVKGTTYARLKSHCDKTASSCSGYVEDLINKALDLAGEPEISREEADKMFAPKERGQNGGFHPGAHFTF